MLSGYKTYIAAAGLAIYAGVGWALSVFAPDVAASAGIHVDLQSAIMLVLNAFGLGGLRAAVTKGS